MARSRKRTSRRTVTQRAAGLIALALPAPVQRVADTRIGSLIMLVGVPAMIVFGLLNVTWVDGFPTFTFNRNRAAELRNAARQELNNLEHQAAAQNWSQSTLDFLHAAQGPDHEHHGPGLPSMQPQASSPNYDWQQQHLQQRQYNEQPLRQQQQYQPQQYQPQQYQPQQYQPPYQPPPYTSQQSNQQWPANGGQQPYQGYNPSTYSQTPGQPYGYPAQQYNNSYSPPAANNGTSLYYNQSGQLGRY